MSVFRIYVEKKPGLDNEARALRGDINELLMIVKASLWYSFNTVTERYMLQ